MDCIYNAKNLIQLIRGYLGKSSEIKDVDWKRAFYIAKAHSLSTIFYDTVKERADVPDNVKLIARNSALAQIHQQVQQDYYAQEIYKQLYENNIKFMPMKGSVLRQLYQIPEHRLSCDVDILYDVEKQEKVKEILENLDFKKDKEWHNGVVTVEMHEELFSEYSLGYEYFSNVWEKLKTDDGIKYYFSDEDFYIYFMTHTAKHFFNGGFGIRTVLDVYEFNTAKNLDKEYLKTEFEKLGLYKFTHMVEELAKYWFDDDYSATEEVTALSDIILSSGVYGAERNSVMVKNIKKNSNNKHARLKYLFVTLFPKYRTMKILYPFLKYLPFMLPFMWVYKWFEVLLVRRKSIAKFTGNMDSMSEQKVDKFRKVLESTDFPVDKNKY